MKISTLAFCLFFFGATVSFAQTASVLNSQPVITEFQSHPEHASYKAMSEAQNLLTESGFTYGKGERPLWEVASKNIDTPLGDTARMLRKEHESVKKSSTVWVN